MELAGWTRSIMALVLLAASCTSAAPPEPAVEPLEAPVVAAVDPCVGLQPAPEVAPVLEPRIELGLLSLEAVSGPAPGKAPGKAVDLGRMTLAPLGSIAISTGGGKPRSLVDLGRAPMPLEAVVARLGVREAEAYRAAHEARARRNEAFGLGRAGKQALSCLDLRAAELVRLEGALARELQASSSPMALVVRGELLMARANGLEDEHLADLTFEEAADCLRRARDATKADDLVGYFARHRLVEAELARGSQKAAQLAARSILGVAPPVPALLGDAELRAAEIEPEAAVRRGLFEASARAAPETSPVHLVALAGLLSTLIDQDDRAAALMLADRMARMPVVPGGFEPDSIAADAYARLLPDTPAWWELSLPRVGASGFVSIADALADVSEQRGDLLLARRLRERALATVPAGRDAQRIREKLAKTASPAAVDDSALRARVTRLVSDCRDGPGPLKGSSKLSFDGKVISMGRGLQGTGANVVTSCLGTWGATYLRGLPALSVELLVATR